MDDVAITELEKIDATRVDGVGMPANGIPILLMKGLPATDGHFATEDEVRELGKDWADWDAAHEGGGKGSAPASSKGDSKASAASAVARAKQTIADHKAGKKVDAADLKNAHEVHEAHLAHEAKLAAEGKAPAAAKPKAATTAKPAAGKPAAAKPATAKKGLRDCPKCDKSYDADHTGSKCENCGTDLPDPATKAADSVDCPTCKGDGKIMGDKRDCPDCDASGSVTPVKAKTLAAKAVVKAIVGRKVDETPDIAGGSAVIAQIADLIIAEAQELKAGNTGEIDDIFQLAQAAELMWTWRTGEESVAAGSVMPATTLKSRDYSAAELKEMASDGRALPDGSYPINDEHDLNNAAILARSGHGDADAAAKHIGKRAKELGVANPLDNEADAAKSQIAKEGTDVDTETQTGGLSKAVEEAVAKAVAPIEKLRRELEETLAKVKATPVPGGPVLSRNVQVKTPGGAVNEDKLADAARYRQKAQDATAPLDREGYLALARKTEQEARTALSA